MNLTPTEAAAAKLTCCFLYAGCMHCVWNSPVGVGAPSLHTLKGLKVPSPLATGAAPSPPPVREVELDLEHPISDAYGVGETDFLGSDSEGEDLFLDQRYMETEEEEEEQNPSQVCILVSHRVGQKSRKALCPLVT